MRRVVALSACLAAAAALAADRPLLTGPAAFGDWRTDAPGVRRLITPADLPPPFATRSTANPTAAGSAHAGRRAEGAAGLFRRSVRRRALATPRRSHRAERRHLRRRERGRARAASFAPTGGRRRPRAQVFAADLPRVVRHRLLSAGADPRWVYVATPARSGAFPIATAISRRPARPRSSCAICRPGACTGRATSPSRRTARRCSSRSARRPTTRKASGRRRRAASLGASWDVEQDRADVLAFDPDGGTSASSPPACATAPGSTMQPSTGALWCVVNERDGLGDDLPPDYATRVVRRRLLRLAVVLHRRA